MQRKTKRAVDQCWGKSNEVTQFVRRDRAGSRSSLAVYCIPLSNSPIPTSACPLVVMQMSEANYCACLLLITIVKVRVLLAGI